MKAIGPALILFLGLMTAALSQDRLVEREVKGKSGQDIRVAIFTNVLADCTAGPLPTIRLVASPEHGKLIVKKARLSATNVKQCLALEVPALVAFYKSAGDYAGSDFAVLEIKTAQGSVLLQRYSITVSPAIPAQKI
jgi:hypothetical protein